MILVKLGGSVITDKNVLLLAREDVIKRLAREISSCKEAMILVHGAGSFGHIKAMELGLRQGAGRVYKNTDVVDVQHDVRALDAIVVGAFHAAGMPVTSIPSGAICLFNGGRMVDFPLDVLTHYLKIGIMPITFGDVVMDRTLGATICSGDDIMRHLAKNLNVTRCIFVTQVDGIYPTFPPGDGEPPLAQVTPDTPIRFLEIEKDVTGGMRRKLEIMFDIAGEECEVRIVNGLVPGVLESTLHGLGNGSEILTTQKLKRDG
ncbi:MAG: isopentenyl phosphate kinase family protein [Gammaproteobacteria bacterium]|nr:isopentenyl phosphate kinase family protein [Gammaproteobacteria bacterium]NNJ83979.1 isopentenyl phosphate kinase family protein [Gammaproteobacteria bacterium]